MQKFASRYFEKKWLSFAIFMPHFMLLQATSVIFLFQLSSIWVVHTYEVFLGHLSLRKSDPQNKHYTIQAQNVHFDLFGFATWDDIDLTRGHQKLMKMFRMARHEGRQVVRRATNSEMGDRHPGWHRTITALTSRGRQRWPARERRVATARIRYTSGHYPQKSTKKSKKRRAPRRASSEKRPNIWRESPNREDGVEWLGGWPSEWSEWPERRQAVGGGGGTWQKWQVSRRVLSSRTNDQKDA